MADTSVSYKCPHCDAPLSFQPGNDKVTCEYCGTELEISAVEDLFQKKQEMAAAIFKYTTTIGIREVPCSRYILKRQSETVETPYGPVRVKRFRTILRVERDVPALPDDVRLLLRRHRAKRPVAGRFESESIQVGT